MKVRTASTGEKRFTAVLYKKVTSTDEFGMTIIQNNKFYGYNETATDVSQRPTEFKCDIVEGRAKEVIIAELAEGITGVGETTVIKFSTKINIKPKDRVEIIGIGAGLVQSYDKMFKSKFEASYRGPGAASVNYVAVIS